MHITQMMRPSGVPVHRLVDLSEDGEGHATRCNGRGIRFYAEMVQANVVYLSAEHESLDDDIASRIVRNGPEVIEALESLVRECSVYAEGLDV